jgi:hypothetical protein
MNLSLFIPITKVDAAKRLVYGVATAEQKDRVGEICDYASTKPLYEKWSAEISKNSGGKSFGNVRAMHGNIAAGKLTEINFNDEDKQIEICAKVVDEAEWNKVAEGVYTGFSQGGSYVKRWKDKEGLQRYTADPSEVSLVDLPCLPSATFEMIKADGLTETRNFKMPAPASNVDIVARAEVLAKAADVPSDWPKYIEIARAELAKESEAGTTAVADVVADIAKNALGKDGATFEQPVDATTGLANYSLEGAQHERPKADQAGNSGFDAKAKIEQGGPRVWKVKSLTKEDVEEITAHATQADADAEAERRKAAGYKDISISVGKKVEPEVKKASPADANPTDGDEWEQVWKCKRDGTTFKTKAELKAHIAELDAAESLGKTTDSILDQLTSISDKLGLGKVEKATDPKKPYGDVEYADPGYQSDGKKRYPIDTDEHIRAAWNYIHKKKNVAKYDADQVKSIKVRISAAWRKKIDKAGPPEAGSKAAQDTLNKGLYAVSRFACLLEDVHSLQRSSLSEETREDDGSDMPDRLKSWLKVGGELLQSMVVEEVDELFDGVGDVNVFCMGAGLGASAIGALGKVSEGDLAKKLVALADEAGFDAAVDVIKKRGARNNKDDLAKLQAVHDAVADLGAVCHMTDMEGKTVTAADLVKMEGALTKATAERDSLKRTYDDRIVPMLEQISKRLANVESQPVALPFAKMRTVEKHEDADDRSAETSQPGGFEDLMKTAEGREKLADIAIRHAQKNPIPLIVR